MNWYNFIRPHGAFDIERLETPAVIYYQRILKREVTMDSTFLENIEGDDFLIKIAGFLNLKHPIILV